MKYFAVFALLTLAVIVVVNAGADSDDSKKKDPCGAKPVAYSICGDDQKCNLCLAKDCFKFALNNDCEGLITCIANSACAPQASG